MNFECNFIRRFLISAVLSTFAANLLSAAEPPTKKMRGPERWEDTIKNFEKIDAITPPLKGAVLLIGGSNARRWKDVDDYFPEQLVINRGFGGARLTDVLHFTDRIVLPYTPKVILLNAGGNDLSSGKSPEQVRETARLFAAKVHAKRPDTRIYHIGLPHMLRAARNPESLAVILKLNQQIADLAHSTKNFDFIDILPAFLDNQGQPRPELFVTDGVHFTPQAYAIISDLLREKL